MALKDTIPFGFALPHRSPDPIDVAAVRHLAQRADARRSWEMRERVRQTMNPAALLIDGNKRWQLCAGFPERAAERENLLRLAAIAAEEDEAAETVLFDDHSLIASRRFALDADHEHLGGFFS